MGLDEIRFLCPKFISYPQAQITWVTEEEQQISGKAQKNYTYNFIWGFDIKFH